jgi:hypothetical protein
MGPFFRTITHLGNNNVGNEVKGNKDGGRDSLITYKNRGNFVTRGRERRFRELTYTVIKGWRFSRPQRDITYQTFLGQEIFNYSRPGRVW